MTDSFHLILVCCIWLYSHQINTSRLLHVRVPLNQAIQCLVKGLEDCAAFSHFAAYCSLGVDQLAVSQRQQPVQPKSVVRIEINNCTTLRTCIIHIDFKVLCSVNNVQQRCFMLFHAIKEHYSNAKQWKASSCVPLQVKSSHYRKWFNRRWQRCSSFQVQHLTCWQLIFT